VGLTNHPRGNEYLADLAVAVDDLMIQDAKNAPGDPPKILK
jgi:hypothetical protein